MKEKIFENETFFSNMTFLKMRQFSPTWDILFPTQVFSIKRRLFGWIRDDFEKLWKSGRKKNRVTRSWLEARRLSLRLKRRKSLIKTSYLEYLFNSKFLRQYYDVLILKVRTIFVIFKQCGCGVTAGGCSVNPRKNVPLRPFLCPPHIIQQSPHAPILAKYTCINNSGSTTVGLRRSA